VRGGAECRDASSLSTAHHVRINQCVGHKCLDDVDHWDMTPTRCSLLIDAAPAPAKRAIGRVRLIVRA